MLFETNPVELSTLVSRVRTGEIQLPDFQRPWKWDDDRIVSLIAAVALGYPLGVMMTLETGGSTLRFKPRPLEGAELAEPVEPEELLMDGQQRLTSLFQALASGKPVETMDSRRKKLKRWYYIDIERWIRGHDMEDAVVSVPEDRRLLDESGKRVALDLSTPGAEQAAGMFPLRLVFDPEELGDWRWDYEKIDKAHRTTWKSFDAQVLKIIEGYKVPVIRLTKDTPKEAVCTVFENVNTKGVQLTVFELLTASYAADDYRLPEEWAAVKDRLGQYDAVREIDDTDFLRAVCLVSTHVMRHQPDLDPFTLPAASCKRSDILSLDLIKYVVWAPVIESALEWSARFLARQGVYFAEDLPYRPQVSALAAIRAVLGDETDSQQAEDKLSRWFWCGVLGEQYSGSLDSRLPRDLEQVAGWIRGGKEPTSVTEATFHAARLDTMATRNSAAYKGVCDLILRQQSIDWVYTNGPIDAAICVAQQVDIALVFPKAWCARHGVETYRQNSIVNKTLLSSRTRQIIGGQAPAEYLGRLETDTGLPGNWIDDIVATHLIDPKLLRANDFDAFYQARSAALLSMIESVMGKRSVSQQEAPESVADYQPEPAA
jgi:hypothetical protein